MSLSLDVLGWFLLVFARTSAFFSFAPPFGGSGVPPPARAGFSFLLSLLLVGWMPVGALPQDGMGWVVVVVGELAAGLALAGFWSLFIGGLQMAGHLMGSQIGLGWAGFYDPAFQESTEVMVVFQRLTGLLIFFCLDGHIRLMELMVRFFQYVPPGAVSFKPEMVAVWSRAFGDLFVMGLKLASPVLLAMWLLTLAVGLVSRAAPQMNILALDFPLRIMVGILVLIVSLPHGVHLFKHLLENFFQQTGYFLRTLVS